MHLSPPALFFSQLADWPELESMIHAPPEHEMTGSVSMSLAVQSAVSFCEPMVASQADRQERRVVTEAGWVHAGSARAYIERMKEQIHFLPMSCPQRQSSFER